jgi:glycerophosphoryl diester phosphodiesterase
MKDNPVSTNQKPLPYDGIAVRHSAISDLSMVQTIKAAGYSLFVWTVNEEEDMKRLINIGVDGIITDRPDRLQDLLVSPNTPRK